MTFISIFNDVLGPVMRGPSSSHTAGSHHIGRIARSLWGDGIPDSAVFTFDPEGSYSRVYRQQSVDSGLASGLINMPMSDEGFHRAVDAAADEGISTRFRIGSLEEASHPNTVEIRLSSPDREMTAIAASIGGGIVAFSQIDGWHLELDGKTHDLIIICRRGCEDKFHRILPESDADLSLTTHPQRPEEILLHYRSAREVEDAITDGLRRHPDVARVMRVAPLFYPRKKAMPFEGSEDMIRSAPDDMRSLGEIGRFFEARQLGCPESEINAEMKHRFEVMRKSVNQGLEEKDLNMRLLTPTARSVLETEKSGGSAVGGIHLRAAARAMAVMHTANSGGVVCAAPTGGSAGVLPGVLVSMIEDGSIGFEKAIRSLFAAGAVGMVIAQRATFAAEVAGCQVEIGAAGAMAAAAVVDAAGGSAKQAADAAAISFQNTMGSVCDLVQGIVEIPCHTRNAVAASNAFLCADLILGGYVNPISLDETIDAVYSVGKMLPRELRCTALGGLAATPSAKAMKRLR